MRWLIPWEFSPAIAMIFAVAAALYARGSARLHVPWTRRCSFWLGLLLMYAALHTHFVYYAQRMFFAHCLQHIILHHDGPFFIALAMPGAALAAGLRSHGRIGAAMRWRIPLLQRIVDMLNHPAVAACLFCAVNAFWMIPAVHGAVMLDRRLSLLMNGSMAVNGLMFWNLALNDYCLRPAGLSAKTRILMMLAIVPPQIAMGLVIFSAPQPIYAAYGMCGRLLHGMTPLNDQQIGGFILWVPAAMMSVVGALAVLARELLRRKAPAAARFSPSAA